MPPCGQIVGEYAFFFWSLLTKRGHFGPIPSILGQKWAKKCPKRALFPLHCTHQAGNAEKRFDKQPWKKRRLNRGVGIYSDSRKREKAILYRFLLKASFQKVVKRSKTSFSSKRGPFLPRGSKTQCFSGVFGLFGSQNPLFGVPSFGGYIWVL